MTFLSDQLFVHVICQVLVSVTLGNPVKRSPDAMSLADGNAEPISAHDGFYGNPLYRWDDNSVHELRATGL